MLRAAPWRRCLLAKATGASAAACSTTAARARPSGQAANTTTTTSSTTSSKPPGEQYKKAFGAFVRDWAQLSQHREECVLNAMQLRAQFAALLTARDRPHMGQVWFGLSHALKDPANVAGRSEGHEASAAAPTGDGGSGGGGESSHVTTTTGDDVMVNPLLQVLVEDRRLVCDLVASVCRDVRCGAVTPTAAASILREATDQLHFAQQRELEAKRRRASGGRWQATEAATAAATAAADTTTTTTTGVGGGAASPADANLASPAAAARDDRAKRKAAARDGIEFFVDIKVLNENERLLRGTLATMKALETKSLAEACHAISDLHAALRTQAIDLAIAKGEAADAQGATRVAPAPVLKYTEWGPALDLVLKAPVDEVDVFKDTLRKLEGSGTDKPSLTAAHKVRFVGRVVLPYCALQVALIPSRLSPEVRNGVCLVIALCVVLLLYEYRAKYLPYITWLLSLLPSHGH